MCFGIGGSMLKLHSWNVNGLRAVLKKNFNEYLEMYSPDILCLQETKLTQGRVNTEEFALPYPYQFYHYADKPGYAGTAILSREEPRSVTYDLLHDKHNHEGRVITADFGSFYLVNNYTPNSQGADKRLGYRVNEWDPCYREHLCALQQKKPVIACGDFNVAHEEIDLENPDSNRNKSPGFFDAERERFSELLNCGFIDTFRYFYPDKTEAYSWWSMRTRARERNVGWRIDYFILSKSMLPSLRSASILAGVQGSDHCPVEITLK